MKGFVLAGHSASLCAIDCKGSLADSGSLLRLGFSQSRDTWGGNADSPCLRAS
jgi:hypothetical protein